MSDTKHAQHLDTAIRLVETVRILQIGRWTTTEQVHSALAARGYTVSVRTVQRDLWKLSGPFGIDVRGQGTAAREWKRTRPLEGLYIPEPIPATPEILEVLRPKPKGVSIRVRLAKS